LNEIRTGESSITVTSIHVTALIWIPHARCTRQPSKEPISEIVITLQPDRP